MGEKRVPMEQLGPLLGLGTLTPYCASAASLSTGAPWKLKLKSQQNLSWGCHEEGTHLGSMAGPRPLLE